MILRDIFLRKPVVDELVETVALSDAPCTLRPLSALPALVVVPPVFPREHTLRVSCTPHDWKYLRQSYSPWAVYRSLFLALGI